MNMPQELLTLEERLVLLKIARDSMERAVRGGTQAELNVLDYPKRLKEAGATFVTLTIIGELRGCIGTLEPYQSLALDVQEHAIAAALQDYRFPPVRENELENINIEISYLTNPEVFNYSTPAELLNKLEVEKCGVILRDGWRKATFLPQVWEKIPDPSSFLDHLCYKMGVSPNLWQRKVLDVALYQVQVFHEGESRSS